MAPVACFDVFGTCFAFESLAEPFEKEFGDALQQDRTNGRALALLW